LRSLTKPVPCEKPEDKRGFKSWLRSKRSLAIGFGLGLAVAGGTMCLLESNPDSIRLSLYRKGWLGKSSLSLPDKIEVWKSDIAAGPCGENHGKVLLEIREEEGLLIERALQTGNGSEVEPLILFERMVVASRDFKQQIPECKRKP
jgi:hypothetical protein